MPKADPMHTTAQPQFASHQCAGLSADGPALADGVQRDTLHQALRLLGDAEAITGSLRAPAMCDALTELARSLAVLHAYSAAESQLAQALGWASMMGGHDLCADLHCAWAEVATNAADTSQAQGEPAAGRAARGRARSHALAAAHLAGLSSDPNWEIRLLLRTSDVLDHCGDHDDAVQLQQRALVLMGLGLPAREIDDAFAAATAAEMGPMTAPGALM